MPYKDTEKAREYAKEAMRRKRVIPGLGSVENVIPDVIPADTAENVIPSANVTPYNPETDGIDGWHEAVAENGEVRHYVLQAAKYQGRILGYYRNYGPAPAVFNYYQEPVARYKQTYRLISKV